MNNDNDTHRGDSENDNNNNNSNNNSYREFLLQTLQGMFFRSMLSSHTENPTFDLNRDGEDDDDNSDDDDDSNDNVRWEHTRSPLFQFGNFDNFNNGDDNDNNGESRNSYRLYPAFERGVLVDEIESKKIRARLSCFWKAVQSSLQSNSGEIADHETLYKLRAIMEIARDTRMTCVLREIESLLERCASRVRELDAEHDHMMRCIDQESCANPDEKMRLKNWIRFVICGEALRKMLRATSQKDLESQVLNKLQFIRRRVKTHFSNRSSHMMRYWTYLNDECDRTFQMGVDLALSLSV